ncbi:hypothetical protein E2C01_096088 [Portunus trituberculatus]|uniref:Uncharacterized protein n=1 Tax=Portunus trituberculatus TaxID=210409 RepID=A0A5B7K145_PORTR|nr:hypothetical protein [Portunus trituberculatus]
MTRGRHRERPGREVSMGGEEQAGVQGASWERQEATLSIDDQTCPSSPSPPPILPPKPSDAQSCPVPSSPYPNLLLLLPSPIPSPTSPSSSFILIHNPSFCIHIMPLTFLLLQSKIVCKWVKSKARLDEVHGLGFGYRLHLIEFIIS